MKLLFKQRFFSWLDSYDIYDENGQVVFTVEGKLAWGHRLHILDASGRHIGTVKEVVFAFLPRFELYDGERCIGYIRKEFSLFRPRFTMDCMGWQVEGDFFEWDYRIVGTTGTVAVITKELWNWTDTYSLNIADPRFALPVLMTALAIDAEKCSRS